MNSGACLEGRGSMGGYVGPKAGLDLLAKEISPFNIRNLTVILGTFNTNMLNAFIVGKRPFPEDYKGSVAAQPIEYLTSGNLVPNGDKDKAMKAVYEVVVVVGEGIGKGRDGKRLLPLGSDMVPRVEGAREFLGRGLEVSGVFTRGVGIDG